MISIKKQLVSTYFQCWLEQNPALLGDFFSLDVCYTECYGPEYHGLDQILMWFQDWNREGQVLEWSILDCWELDDTLIVKWFFRYTHQGRSGCFDGVSIIRFDKTDKICSIEEFKSEHTHLLPYN